MIPLYSLGKAQLQKLCHQHGVQWIEDPTNKSLIYKRNQIRQGLRTLQGITMHYIITG